MENHSPQITVSPTVVEAGVDALMRHLIDVMELMCPERMDAALRDVFRAMSDAVKIEEAGEVAE